MWHIRRARGYFAFGGDYKCPGHPIKPGRLLGNGASPDLLDEFAQSDQLTNLLQQFVQLCDLDLLYKRAIS